MLTEGSRQVLQLRDSLAEKWFAFKELLVLVLSSCFIVAETDWLRLRPGLFHKLGFYSGVQTWSDLTTDQFLLAEEVSPEEVLVRGNLAVTTR